MVQKVRLSAVLPEGDRNGLIDVVPRLIDDPYEKVMVVGAIEVSEIRTLLEGRDTADTLMPIVRLVVVEPCATMALDRKARDLLAQATHVRTGLTTLFNPGVPDDPDGDDPAGD